MLNLVPTSNKNLVMVLNLCHILMTKLRFDKEGFAEVTY